MKEIRRKSSNIWISTITEVLEKDVDFEDEEPFCHLLLLKKVRKENVHSFHCFFKILYFSNILKEVRK